MRRRFLKCAVASIFMIGAALAIYVLLASLMPRKNATDPGFLVVYLNELEEERPRVYEYNQYPVLLVKHLGQSGEVKILAYIGLPSFSDKFIKGCGVRPAYEYPDAKNINKYAVFYEPCRGVVYGVDGTVLDGSAPTAQRLMPLRARISGAKVYVGKFT